MAYFRKLPKMQELLDVFFSKENWLILINADPDAMASAMALKRIMSHRVNAVEIASINHITRPDNLAMVRNTRLHMSTFEPDMVDRFDRFALVDSQPHHSSFFQDISFSVVIDHHPLPESPVAYPYADIRPDYGANSTMMTEYLYNLGIRPGKLLATALQYGIKSDTMNFTRTLCDADLRAFQYLAKFSDQSLLSRISRSEFHRRWLPFFAKACDNVRAVGIGQCVFIGKVENPDILVVIADFLTRVYEFRWVAVSGQYGETAVVIYRGDGSRDIGRLASTHFSDIGSAGGHKSLARAEFPVSATGGENLKRFIFNRLLEAPAKK